MLAITESTNDSIPPTQYTPFPHLSRGGSCISITQKLITRTIFVLLHLFKLHFKSG